MGKMFEERSHVIAERPALDACLFQHMPGQDVEIELRRNAQGRLAFQHAGKQAWVIEISSRVSASVSSSTRETQSLLSRASVSTTKVKILSGEPVPTIRSNHRELT